MSAQFPEPEDQLWLREARPSLLGQAAYTLGRAGDTLGLIVVGGLSALLIGVLLVCLLIAALSGSLIATLMMLAALAGVVFAFARFQRRTRQVAISRQGAAALLTPDVAAELSSLEAERIQKLAHLTLRAGASLNPALRQRLNAAATATRDALRATAVGGVLTREAHDARQAADDDLPAALSAYQDLRTTGSNLSYGEVLLSEQLSLIERRMRTISEAQAQQHTRKLEAGRRYLSNKYGEDNDLS
ncbi:hypothetical protein DKM44_08060 [Deinococcus irradiatisoli]|uniref:Uncharacterized protein n=1 Tax=Deinococcus irradiatisoli TaxID=2202254 RepID=A0A2Z3JQD8_9DEIO|nr:hypothetical protein [Deinococcus irradiatisoli]AWN23184.1 hypothetical protein DKM44_08060 [Deinococcus irradiatisoli]